MGNAHDLGSVCMAHDDPLPAGSTNVKLAKR